MSKKNRITLPQSGGGLVRYFDEYKSKIEIKPTYVIAFIVLIVILMFILHKMKPLG